MNTIPFHPLKEINSRYKNEIKEAISTVLDNGRYINGRHVAELEHSLAALCGTRYCVAVSNGLDALRLILRAWLELGVLNVGDEVIVPANTYIATALAVSDCGLKPVLVDASHTTMNLDTSLIEAAVTSRTKAVMPVHLYGTPCFDETLKTVAAKHGLLIIEDNAQAIGARAAACGINGSALTGGLGHAAATSFYPTKNLGALGDAGAVTTNDEQLAECIRALANYGSDRRYHNIYRGFNCRMDELQAAILLVKIKFLDAENISRNEAALAYDRAIKNPEIETPAFIDGTRQVWHQYVVRCQNREKFREYLNENGVQTDIHYPLPFFKQPCYAEEFAGVSMPVAQSIADKAVSLPIAGISQDCATKVAEVINGFSS